VGQDEFQAWAGGLGIDTMLAVNLGTSGADAVRSLVEYANHSSGTYWSDLRRGRPSVG
jgi:alpha-N-arabinofuranosidase